MRDILFIYDIFSALLVYAFGDPGEAEKSDPGEKSWCAKIIFDLCLYLFEKNCLHTGYLD